MHKEFSSPPDAPDAATIAHETRITRLALVVLAVVTIVIARYFGLIFLDLARLGRTAAIVEELLFVCIVSYLLWSTGLSFVCRIGYFTRMRDHRPASREDLETVYDAPAVAPLTVLIPSYREEESVVRQALLAAALMEYPDRTVVLLIDDPPEPEDATAATALGVMRRLPHEIQALLEAQAALYDSELARFEERSARGELDAAIESTRLSELYIAAAAHLEELARRMRGPTHTDALFVARILQEPARHHRARAAALASATSSGAALRGEAVRREYRRLAALFAARITAFERKRYANLSHAPNKAMNLNSYLGLIGRSVRETTRDDGVYLEACAPAIADRTIPRAEYVITIDADSLVLHDYALRLTHVMAQPGHERVAVVQTPYTAVPGTGVELERTAGAQTDHQWIMSQGLTRYNATFWIGASALLRYAALEEICQLETERGHQVRKYIRDRTLTEDSESTIDMVIAGWQLHNYPDRLSYSATPPDFGSLVIQRRRWANGGLLILPKLFRHLLTGRRRMAWPEAMLRMHYLASTAAGSVAMLALLAYPFGDSYPTPYTFGAWLPLASVPYFLLLARDLRLCGYTWADVARITALNLLLLLVNLGGVLKSVQQWWTAQPTVFARTPKVTGRTAAPALYVVLTLLITAWCAVRGVLELRQGHWSHAPFLFVSGAALLYAAVRFLGPRGIWEDLTRPLRGVPRLVALRDEMAAGEEA